MNLYPASVPVFSRYLGQLQGLLDKAGTLVAQGRLSERELLKHQLCPNMLPFGHQANTTVGFALRACFPLAGQAIPVMNFTSDTLTAVQNNVRHGLAQLALLTSAPFERNTDALIQTTAGEAALSLTAFDYLNQYALPNFYFHLSMVYALLRLHCVDLGKSDFDGFHRYPPGFSFP